MKLILGSGSPRRKIILERILGSVQVVSPSIDENMLENESADDYTKRITNLKMDAVLSGLDSCEKYCVVTADTIVSIDEFILGKPLSKEDAFSMLRLLSDKEHFVITGLCIAVKNGNAEERVYSSEKTSVKFKMLSDDVILDYLGKVNYSDKAGAYAIQEHGEILVDSVRGSMTNVIGFPLRLFFSIINKYGLYESLLH